METDYRYIRAWGHVMGGSSDSYVTAQVKKARAANAPPTAIYEKWAPDGTGPTGEWAIYENITNPNAKASLDAFIAEKYPASGKTV